MGRISTSTTACITGASSWPPATSTLTTLSGRASVQSPSLLLCTSSDSGATWGQAPWGQCRVWVRSGARAVKMRRRWSEERGRSRQTTSTPTPRCSWGRWGALPRHSQHQQILPVIQCIAKWEIINYIYIFFAYKPFKVQSTIMIQMHH